MEVSNKIELDLLLKMYYEKYDPESCKITKHGEDYYISGTAIKGTKLFKFISNSLGKKVVFDENNKSTEEFEYVNELKLTRIEKWMVLSYLLGNNLMKDSIPSKVRNKLVINNEVAVNESSDVSLTI